MRDGFILISALNPQAFYYCKQKAQGFKAELKIIITITSASTIPSCNGTQNHQLFTKFLNTDRYISFIIISGSTGKQ